MVGRAQPLFLLLDGEDWANSVGLVEACHAAHIPYSFKHIKDRGREQMKTQMGESLLQMTGTWRTVGIQ